MPDKRAYLAAAQRDQKVIDRLLEGPTDFSEWITTIAFYKALHLVEALFAHDGAWHEKSHVSRELLLKATTRYSHIYEHYRSLWNASMVARYLQGESIFSNYLSLEEVRSELLNHRLKKIEKSVSNLMKRTPKKGRRRRGKKRR